MRTGLPLGDLLDADVDLLDDVVAVVSEPQWGIAEELAALQVELTWEIVRTLRAQANPKRRPPDPLRIPRPHRAAPPSVTPAALAMRLMGR